MTTWAPLACVSSHDSLTSLLWRNGARHARPPPSSANAVSTVVVAEADGSRLHPAIQAVRAWPRSGASGARIRVHEGGTPNPAPAVTGKTMESADVRDRRSAAPDPRISVPPLPEPVST